MQDLRRIRGTVREGTAEFREESIMSYSYFAVTKEGQDLAARLSGKFEGDLLPLTEVKPAFAKKDVLVFIMAAGVVLRLLAPLIEAHKADPAVVLLDQEGRFVIPLLSGHTGSANGHAKEIADFLGAQAVITTATDLCQVLSFEEIAKRNDLIIENLPALKTISALLLKGASVELHTDHETEWESSMFDRGSIRILHYDPEDERAILRGYQMCAKEETAAVFLTARQLPAREDGTYPPNILILRPKDIIIGISCRSRVNEEYVFQALKTALDHQNLPEDAIAKLATIPLKFEEPALVMLSERLGVPLETVENEDIRKVEYMFIQTPFAHPSVSLAHVSAPLAFLASGRGRILMARAAYPGGVTLAIAQEKKTIYL